MISGYFPAETRRRLKIVAARQDQTLQQVMADAFEAWLRHDDKEEWSRLQRSSSATLGRSQALDHQARQWYEIRYGEFVSY